MTSFQIFRNFATSYNMLFMTRVSLVVVTSFQLLSQVPSFSSLLIEVYNPKTFFLHAALLHQSSLHCAISPTAASRRSLGRVSVPMWPLILSDRLLIVDLVGCYLTNYLIRRGSILHRWLFSHRDRRLRALMRY